MPVLEHVGVVQGFEGSIAGLMKGNQNGHDFAETELARALAAVLTADDKLAVPGR